MALDAGVYPQDSFGYVCKELYALGSCGYQFGLQEADDKAFVAMLDNCMEPQSLQFLNWEQNVKEVDHNSSPEACTGDQQVVAEESPVAEAPTQPLVSSGRRKRRRTRCCKNKEELENQRMTHIAVERNRRKQMNEYLAVIRSLMPASYVQRGDQASIIAGAINFVKELEQHVQNLDAQKRAIHQECSNINKNAQSPLFADFFTFPQYSTHPNSSSPTSATSSDPPSMAEKNRSALADIEVTMVESHANLKILSKRRPRQLLKIVAGLQCLWLTILHLNVTTTVDQMVLYSLSVKLEEECQLSTVDEIADAVHHLLGRIQEEAML